MATQLGHERPRGIRGYLSDVFGIDLRSLALFRVAMGSILLVDLATRAPYIEAFYTDDGFFTRDLANDYFAKGFWSFHLLSGSETFQTILFVVAAIFALMLTIGCWTRVATIVSWLFLISLHVRNPILLNSGDSLLRAMLFWSMFLPLGQVMSLDAWRRTRRSRNKGEDDKPTRAPNRIVTGASAALIIQLCFMYWFTGLAKLNEPWLKGEALEYVLRMDLFIKPFGKQLLEYPRLLSFLSVSTVWLELLGPFLLFLPIITRHTRLLAIAMFFSLHIGIVASISVGLFSLISMMGWLPLVPETVWSRLSTFRRLRPANAQRTTRRRVRKQQRAATTSVSYPVLMVPQGRLGFVSSFLALLMLGYLFAWNVYNIESLADSKNPILRWGYQGLETTLRDPWFGSDNELFSGAVLGRATMTAQEFEMFGPVPHENHWFVYRARLENGKIVNLLDGELATDERPEPMMWILPDHRWRKLHRNLMEARHAPYRAPLAYYFCQKWNREHGPNEQIVKMEMVSYSERIQPEVKTHGFVEIKLASFTFREEEQEMGAFADLLEAMQSGDGVMPWEVD